MFFLPHLFFFFQTFLVINALYLCVTDLLPHISCDVKSHCSIMHVLNFDGLKEVDNGAL